MEYQKKNDWKDVNIICIDKCVAKKWKSICKNCIYCLLMHQKRLSTTKKISAVIHMHFFFFFCLTDQSKNSFYCCYRCCWLKFHVYLLCTIFFFCTMHVLDGVQFFERVYKRSDQKHSPIKQTILPINFKCINKIISVNCKKKKNVSNKQFVWIVFKFVFHFFKKIIKTSHFFSLIKLQKL